MTAAEAKRLGGNRVMTELMRREFIALTAWLGRFVVALFGQLGRSLPE